MNSGSSHIDEAWRAQSRGWRRRFVSKWLGLIPIALIVVLTAVLAISNVHTSMAPPILFPILNTLFIFSMYSIAAYFAAGTFLRTGSWQLLLFGTGILMLGTSATLAAWLSGVGGLNLVTKVHNVNALVASSLILSVAALAWKGISPRKEPGRLPILITAYAAALAFIALVTVLAMEDIIPTFVNASGPTVLRQTIYGTAAAIIGISAFWLLRLYYRSKVDFLYWCCLGFVLITIGFTAGLFATILSDAISWLARISLYFSGIYFIIAGLVARAEAQTRGVEIHELIAEFAKQAKVNYELLVNTASDAIIAVDGPGRILMWNPAAEKMFGYSQSEAIGSAFFDLIISPEHVGSYKKAADTVALERDSTEPPVTMELKVRKRNGEKFPVELKLASIKLTAKRLPTTMLILRDITERKRAEEALRESEQRWAITLASIGDAVISTDAEGRITFMNAVAEALTGWMFSEASTKPVAEVFNIINENTRLEADNPVTRVLREGTIIGLANHTILVRKDGTEVPIDDSGAPIRNGDGNTMGVVLVFRDITERKKAEEALKESEERLRFALETSHTGAWDLDLVDHTAHRSLEHDHIFGYEQLLPQWTYEMFLDHVLPEDRAKVDAKFREAVASCSDWSFECHIRRVDGEVRWIWAAGRHQEDATGSSRRMAGIVQDITERKRAEEALRKAHDELETRVQERTTELKKTMEALGVERQRFNDVLDVLPAYVVLLTPDYHVPFANRFFRERFGGSHGRRCFEYLFGRSEPCEICETYTVLRTMEPHHWEWTGPDGRNYDIFDFPFTDTDGSTLILEMGIDITERKRAEEALLESETRYRELSESINEIFFAVDKDFKYTYWNKASETFTGISAKDAVGKSLYELFPDIKGTKAEQLYIEALKTQQPQHFENPFQIGGKKFIFEISAYPTKTGLSVIAKDITEKKMFEAHLLRAQRMESIGILAGGIAHNLNNMLTPMMLSLQMLKEKFKDERSQKLLTILEQNSQRGADLIKQVLSFSRGVEGERNPLQVARIITEIEKIAKETFPRNIEIRTDIHNDLFTISGDITQLHQVIMNLCVNARDAMPDGGTLSITASNFSVDENYARVHTEAKVGSYAVIAVSDTGIGIPPKVLDRIFEPFFTTKEFGKGTGLGLSTSIAIVKSHGGFIDVHSEVGKGATFSVYLPAIKAKTQNIEEQQLELLSGQGELVLVAEDEDSVREITISTLEKYGYNVLTANDGADTVAVYAQNSDKIRVILMDMMMPVMDGQESIRVIRRINSEVKIIAVSGLAEKDKLANIADYTNAFLPKPYTAERLLKIIHEVLSVK